VLGVTVNLSMCTGGCTLLCTPQALICLNINLPPLLQTRRNLLYDTLCFKGRPVYIDTKIGLSCIHRRNYMYSSTLTHNSHTPTPTSPHPPPSSSHQQMYRTKIRRFFSKEWHLPWSLSCARECSRLLWFQRDAGHSTCPRMQIIIEDSKRQIIQFTPRCVQRHSLKFNTLPPCDCKYMVWRGRGVSGNVVFETIYCTVLY
jgi:hypothetical protein